MIDNLDTVSSRQNKAKVWNTRRNHAAWRLYLRQDAKSRGAEPYAAVARARDLSGLPPLYTFVSTAEPFYAETLAYVLRLRSSGVAAEVDVYDGLHHAFDMLEPDLPESVLARERFGEQFAWAVEHCFAPQVR
jgi:acetyl esterase/lipase